MTRSLPHNLKIGELASYTGCSIETIRYYEQEGLLPKPQRSEGNYRLYNEIHIERLQFIIHCRALDMSLAEIRSLLLFKDEPDQNCMEVNVLLDEHISHVEHRINELKTLEQQLKNLRSLCRSNQSNQNCEILKSLAHPLEPQSTTSSKKPRHVKKFIC